MRLGNTRLYSDFPNVTNQNNLNVCVMHYFTKLMADDEMKNGKSRFRLRGRKTLKRGPASTEIISMGEKQQESNLIRVKPSFAEFKQKFMEKSISDESLDRSEDNPASIASTTDSLVSHSLEKVSFY